jgi:hypothetical protein
MHPELLNANMKKTQYAVRGELYLKAEELRQAGREIIFTNGEARAAPGAAADPAPAAHPPRPRRSGQPARAGRQAHHLHPPGARHRARRRPPAGAKLACEVPLRRRTAAGAPCRRQPRRAESAAPSPQVLALCTAPFLLEHPKVNEMFPEDAIARAKKILASFKGGVGAYSDSRGNPLVREEVAKFIEERDGVKSNPNVSARRQLPPPEGCCRAVGCSQERLRSLLWHHRPGVAPYRAVRRPSHAQRAAGGCCSRLANHNGRQRGPRRCLTQPAAPFPASPRAAHLPHRRRLGGGAHGPERHPARRARRHPGAHPAVPPVQRVHRAVRRLPRALHAQRDGGLGAGPDEPQERGRRRARRRQGRARHGVHQPGQPHR